MTDLADLIGEKIFTDPNFYKPSGEFKAANAIRISLRCPHCGKEGIFDPITQVNDALYPREYRRSGALAELGKLHVDHFVAGIRSCPNSKCRGVVSIVARTTETSETLLACLPPALIHFQSHNIPSKISESMKEAVAANGAQAYRASTLMVRRALELLCNEKGASGQNLKERIKNLSAFVTLPPALFEAADELRILGNDSVHVEARDYDDITREHSDLAIEVAMKILESVYQHDELIFRLKKLKKP